MLCRVFKKPVTKIKHDIRSTLDVRPSLVIGYLGNWHAQNIVDILILTGFYILEHKINNYNENNRCINIKFKLNLSDQVNNHNKNRNIKINIDKIIKYSESELFKIYKNTNEYIDPNENTMYLTSFMDSYSDNNILISISIKYINGMF